MRGVEGRGVEGRIEGEGVRGRGREDRWGREGRVGGAGIGRGGEVKESILHISILLVYLLDVSWWSAS